VLLALERLVLPADELLRQRYLTLCDSAGWFCATVFKSMPSRETESYYEVLHQTQIKAYVSLPESCNGLNRNMGMDDPVSYTMDTGLFPGDKAAETQS
jgi:uncharacterized protein YceK